ncbi:hypothetical protein BTJ39_03280 [Izhakiella australiensis]|uniref:Peptidase n=1 Tax=Izhakiella australiensis TaxID=1926881 RepID=A0A1S8YU72_9GAMM|nr:Rha family phage regulatory protein [Izhakiella australiensis]OON42183.1 hypothetical protein BTJ39_03280 [Izhakiella australiensis]
MINAVLATVINGRYSFPAPYKAGAGIGTPPMTIAHDRASGFFTCKAQPQLRSMVGRAGQLKSWPVSVVAGSSNPVRLATHEIGTSGGEFLKLTIEAATMATTLTPNVPAVTAAPAVFEHNGKILTTSLAVAEYFHKTHDNVLKKIRAVIADCEPEWCLVNFNEASREVIQPNGGTATYKCFELTRDAFVLIVMGFTGKRALQWKIDYISAFNRMESTLHGAPELTDSGDRVASRTLIAFDRSGNVLFTESVSRDAIVGDFDKFRWFAGKLGYLVVKEDQLLEALRSGYVQENTK